MSLCRDGPVNNILEGDVRVQVTAETMADAERLVQAVEEADLAVQGHVIEHDRDHQQVDVVRHRRRGTLHRTVSGHVADLLVHQLIVGRYASQDGSPTESRRVVNQEEATGG